MSAAAVRDATVLAALHAAGFDDPAERAWDAAEFARLLALPHCWALAAPAEAPSGFILAWVIGAEAEILTLAVSPDARRRGIGRALVEAAMAQAGALGAGAMLLEVRADNDAARGLYAALGFVQAGVRTGYYRRGDAAVDALVLRRNLS